jgi:quinol monooxygenase YgiN
MVIAYFTMNLRKGTRDAFLREMNELNIFDKSRSETGNISYDYYLPLDGEDTLVGLERWENIDAFRAHVAGKTVASLQTIQEKYMSEMIPYLYESTEVEENKG